MHRISVAGHFCVDLLPQLPAAARLAPGQLIDVGPLTVKLGGCVANTGLFLHDLGADVELQGTVGDDWLGKLAAQLLAAASGGRWTPEVVSGAGTSYSLVLEPGGADRTFWHHTGVNALFDTEWVRVGADLLHFGYPPLLPSVLADDAAPVVALFTRAHGADQTISLDLAVVDPDGPVGSLDWPALLDRILPLTDIISPSVDDLRSMYRVTEPGSLQLAEQFADDLVSRGAAIALVTAGEHGLVLRTAGPERLRDAGRAVRPLADAWSSARVIAEPARLGEHLTSTGAGDAASAGLLYAISAGVGPEQAVRLAAATSAAVMWGRRPTPDAVAAVEPFLAEGVEVRR